MIWEKADDSWSPFRLRQAFLRIRRLIDNNILGRALFSGGFFWLAGDHEFQLYECERVQEARIHGIQTLACISTLSGVLELASLDVIQQDWGLVHLTKSLFRSNDDDHNRLPNQQATRQCIGSSPEKWMVFRSSRGVDHTRYPERQFFFLIIQQYIIIIGLLYIVYVNLNIRLIINY
ncbi:unnamed protein product [Malus baccata var. baccata]